MALTPKQERFAREYLIDLNGAAAAIRSGYSSKTAKYIANELLKKPEIQAAVTAQNKKRMERTESSADRVIKELERIAFFDIRKLFREDNTLKSITELDDETAAAIAGIEVLEQFYFSEAVAARQSEDDTSPSPTPRKGVGSLKKWKVWDKKGALDSLMRHHGLFNDKIGVKFDLSSLTEDELHVLEPILRKLSANA